MPSGLTSTLPDDLALNVAVLYHTASIVGGAVSGTKISATKGGLDFEPGIKTRDIQFDGGDRSAIAELEYVIGYDAHIKGKIIQLGSDQIEILEAGAALVGDTYTPRAADVLYESTDYMENVMCAWERGNGALFVVEFPVARVVSYKIDGKDKSEAEITIDLKAFLSLADAVTDTSLCPYKLHNVPA
jgi:hypothetical protein